MVDRSQAFVETLLAMHRQADPTAVVNTLLTRLAPSFGRAGAACFLREADSGQIKLHTLLDTAGELDFEVWRAELNAPLTLPLNVVTRLLAAAQRNGLPAVSADQPADLLGAPWTDRVTSAIRAVIPGRSSVLAPVVSAAGPLGLITLFPTDGWPADLTLEALSHAAQAVATTAERGSATQGAADLFMRGIVEQVATRELHRADRYRRPLSVVLVEVPAEHNAPVVQVAAAALIAKAMRMPDTAGQLDASRMAVILPETPGAGALAFIRRLHRRAWPTVPALACGAATFPDDGRTWEELVEVAKSHLSATPPPEATNKPTIFNRPVPIAPTVLPTAPVDGTSTLRVRVAPLLQHDMSKWQSLLERLPSVLRVQTVDYDQGGAVYELFAPSMARVLSDLRQTAKKMGGNFTPSMGGEALISLRQPSRPVLLEA